MNATALMNPMSMNNTRFYAPTSVKNRSPKTAQPQLGHSLSNLGLSLELSCMEISFLKHNCARQYPALMATRHYKLSLRLRQMLRRNRR